MCFRKPETIPLLFIIGAIALLMGLGIWQVERLEWKNTMLADIERAQAMPTLGTLPQDLNDTNYRSVALTGTFIYDKALHLVAPPHGSVTGFFIVTPFKLEDDGRIILVNRGFAPQNQEAKPGGTQTITGIVRPVRKKRFSFLPANSTEKNVWFYEDIPEMTKATGLELTPMIVEAVGKPEEGVYPIPGDGKIRMRNDHLQYAITWFSLVIIAVVMFAAYHYIPGKKHD